MALSPTSSHGGGLPLTGGTLTDTLTDTPSNVGHVAFAAVPAVGATAAATDTYESYDDTGNLLWFVDAKGNFLLDLSKHVGASMEMDALGSASLVFTYAGGFSARLAALQTFKVFDHLGAAKFTVDESTGKIVTAPPASEAATLALGTAYQHATDRDVLLTVYLSVTVNTSGVLKLGVGPTNTPTQQTLVTGITSTGLWTVPIYLPAGYYALLSTTGTITVAVDGQIAIPV